MRITALFLLLILSAALSAAEIPSAASGRYQAPGEQCSVVFSRFGADHVNVDLTCGNLSSHSTAFAFGGACIGGPGVAYAFPRSGSNPDAGWIAFDAVFQQDGLTGLQVRRGTTALQLYQGGGQAEVWWRLEALPSPQPYTCGAPEINRRALAGFCRRNPSAALCGG